jgi:hypothetical protein
MRYLVLVLALLSGTPLLAKGGNMRSADRYEPQHIENLPPEVRRVVIGLCPAPKALHSFATFTDHLEKVVLHYERLYCGERSFCGPSRCLHQTYVVRGGHYHLIESFYAREGN